MQPKNWATSVAVAHLTLRARERALAGGEQGAARRSGAATPRTRRCSRPSDAAHRAHRRVRHGAHRHARPCAWRADSARVARHAAHRLHPRGRAPATGADLASTAAFSLDASLDAGPITVARLAALYPYDNTLRAVRITRPRSCAPTSSTARATTAPAPTARAGVDPSVPGYNFDIVAGADYTIDLSRPVGQRVTRLDVQGPRRCAPTDSFTMALNNYRQTGGGGYAMLAGAPVVYDEQEEIRQLLVDEVRRRGTIDPRTTSRRNWRIEPATPSARCTADARDNREDAHAAGTRAQRGPHGRSRRRAGTRTAATRPRRLRIIATNDFHGALEPRADAHGRLARRRRVPRRGASRRARDGVRAAAPARRVLLDGGDEFQGTPASNLAFGRPVVRHLQRARHTPPARSATTSSTGARTRCAPACATRDYAILGANVTYADGARRAAGSATTR